MTRQNMTGTHGTRAWRQAAAVAAIVAAAACADAKSQLLEAPDPDLIAPELVQSPDGANAVRIGALARLRTATAGSDGDWLFGGLLTDEWSTSSTFIQNDEADQRRIALNNGTVTGFYRDLNRVRTASNQAIGLMKTFSPTPASNIAELYFARGFAEAQLAQDFCSGLVMSDGTAASPTGGVPITNDQAFNIAIASYDSALALATASDAATTLIRNAATVGKARALIGLNNHAAALALATPIATSFTYDVTFSTTSGDNTLWGQPNSSARYTVGDSLEGNARNLLVTGAQPFFLLQDPRLPVKYTVSADGKDTTKAQDGQTFVRKTTLWARTTSVPIVNGIDARMVEAEAKIKANDIAGGMAVLNALRAAPPKLGEVQATAAGLPQLAIPATQAEAIDVFFREKGFWTFSRGQRLSDRRRMMRQYSRSMATTFPTGNHYRGGTYGTDVNFPVPIDEANNPNFTACTNRNP
jgi:hypothetical protein